MLALHKDCPLHEGSPHPLCMPTLHETASCRCPTPCTRSSCTSSAHPVCTRFSLAQGFPTTHLHTCFARGVALHKDDSLHKGLPQPTCTPVLHKEHLLQEGSPLYRCSHKPFAHPFCTTTTHCTRGAHNPFCSMNTPCTRTAPYIKGSATHLHTHFIREPPFVRGVPTVHLHTHFAPLAPLHKGCCLHEGFPLPICIPVLHDEYPLHKDCSLHKGFPQPICTLISHEGYPLHEGFPQPVCTLILHDEHPCTRAPPCTGGSQYPFAHLFCTMSTHYTRISRTRGSHSPLAHSFCTMNTLARGLPLARRVPTAHLHTRFTRGPPLARGSPTPPRNHRAQGSHSTHSSCKPPSAPPSPGPAPAAPPPDVRVARGGR